MELNRSRGIEPGELKPAGKWSSVKKELVRNRYVYLMLVPVVAYYLIFSYGPMSGLLMAFQESYNPIKGILAGEWVGFDNFTMFFESYYFWRLIKNTLILSFYSIVFGFPAPILLALLLMKSGRSGSEVQYDHQLYAAFLFRLSSWLEC